MALRVDVMSVMRGVDDFKVLWQRRTTIEDETGDYWDLLSLPDLVRAKKTQRNKDWPMLQRLVEAHYFAHRDEATHEQVAWWLRELRTPHLLREVAARFPDEASRLEPERDVLKVLSAGETAIEAALRREEDEERALDRAYWLPLKQELEELRRQRRA
jgi:hypothetical protein